MSETGFTPIEATEIQTPNEENIEEEPQEILGKYRDPRWEIQDLRELTKEVQAANENSANSDEAKERIIERFMWLIDSKIDKYFGDYKDEYYEDMVQEGKLAILESLPKMSGKVVNPTTLFSRSIFYALVKWENKNQKIGISPTFFVRVRKFKRLCEEQYGQTGTIDYDKIQNAMELDEDSFNNIVTANTLIDNIETVTNEDLEESYELEETNPNSLPKFIPDRQLLDGFFNAFFNSCNERERGIIEWRYGFKDGVIHTLKDVADKYHVTRERIRQIERRVMRRGYHPKIRRLLYDADSSTDDLLTAGEQVNYPDRPNKKSIEEQNEN